MSTEIIRRRRLKPVGLTLQERIDVALGPDAAVMSADLNVLIGEAESAIVKADQLWRTVDQTAPLDPIILAATCAAEQLRMLLPKLQARYQEMQEQEQAAAFSAAQEAAWWTKHDAAECERDALAEELRAVYPNAAKKIAELFARVTANNEDLAELHRSRPAGVEKYLRSAEMEARGLEGFSHTAPSLLTSVQLFDWDSGEQIWPLRRSSPAAGFAATSMQACDRRFSADWAKDNETRAAARQAE